MTARTWAGLAGCASSRPSTSLRWGRDRVGDDARQLIEALLAVLIVVGCVFIVWWFVFGSGLTAPAGFVYVQY